MVLNIPGGLFTDQGIFETSPEDGQVDKYEGGRTIPEDIFKGAWSAVRTYHVGEIVENDGALYVCTTTTLNNEPPNVTYWSLMSSDSVPVSAYSTSNTVERTNSTAFIDYDDVNCTLLSTGEKVLVILTCAGYHETSAKSLSVRLVRDDETAVSPVDYQLKAYQANVPVPMTIMWLDNPSAGSHNYEVQYRSTSVGDYVDLFSVAITAIEMIGVT